MANLKGADMSGAWLMHSRCIDGDMSGANLTRANLYGADLRGTELAGACLRGATLRGATVGALDAMWADFSGADLRQADLSGIQAGGALFTGSRLRDAVVQWADLSKCDLSGADLSYADLSGSDLTAADLTGAVLSGAKLEGVDLTGADLSGADLTGVTGLATATYGEAPDSAGRVLPPTYTDSTRFTDTNVSPDELGWVLLDEDRGLDGQCHERANAQFEVALDIQEEEARRNAVDACVMSYARLAARNPENPRMLTDYADALATSGRHAQAAQMMTDVIEILSRMRVPVSGSLYFRRALFLFATERNSEAIADLSTAIENGEGNMAAYYEFRSYIYRTIGEHEKALADAQAATELMSSAAPGESRAAP